MNNIIIRKETKEDYYATELMTMRAFWNLHGPGCAVKAAIESGELSAKRYELYKNLGRENTKNYAMKKEISKSKNAFQTSRIAAE